MGMIAQGLGTLGYAAANGVFDGKTSNNAGSQVSTLGADRQREDLNRTMTTYGNLASLSGTRGIASLLPNLTQTQNDQTAKIAANLDEQEKQRPLFLLHKQ